MSPTSGGLWRTAFAPCLAATLIAPAGAMATQAESGTFGPSVDIRSKRMHPPVYPVAAFRAGASGTVQLRVSVDAKGRLEDVEIESSSGREDLDAAAMDAARQWTYAPGQRDGMPVAGTLRIPVDYSFDP
ncbi:hypothetical protein CMZ82_15925 [Lysobacteraceae bacterium NML93-0792]|nr:hypothetical protein CMZ82_15925 [Xanthomonadaceae bacterium NML93-0792]PBS14295.1 hypothetical protein CMZ81_16800 [Xanthomonadaceae bacterium NML93-0793]PBS17527.1 hypothetical protein CMZ80_16710 [Xanthomonadaceae bacterium NML93-0831]